MELLIVTIFTFVPVIKSIHSIKNHDLWHIKKWSITRQLFIIYFVVVLPCLSVSPLFELFCTSTAAFHDWISASPNITNIKFPHRKNPAAIKKTIFHSLLFTWRLNQRDLNVTQKTVLHLLNIESNFTHFNVLIIAQNETNSDWAQNRQNICQTIC